MTAVIARHDSDAPAEVKPEVGKFSRTPPQNFEAEQCVLGGMLLSKIEIPAAIEMLKARDFYRNQHAVIFSAIVALYGENEPADPITVAARLLDSGDLSRAGGAPYLHELTRLIPVAANTPHYAGIVAEMGRRRRLVEVSARVSQIAYGTGPGEGLDAAARIDVAQAALHELTTETARSAVVPIADLIQAAFDRFEAAGQGQVAGLSTGSVDLDRALKGGFHPGNLILVAGRPGMGKSVAGVDFARAAAIHAGQPTLFFSLEMTNDELMQRIMSAEAAVPMDRLGHERLDDAEWTRLAKAAGVMGSAPLFFDDTPGQTVLQLKATARRIQQQHGLSLIVVDYTQKAKGVGKVENRQQEVSEIVGGLKDLAKELRVPVVALAQLNRNLESRTDKRPQLSDFRESGALEQEADVVIFVHREDYYDKDSPRAGEVDLIIAKARQGQTCTVTLASQLHLSRFVDMAIM